MTQKERLYLEDELKALLEWQARPLNPQLREIVEDHLKRVRSKLQA